MDFKVNVVFPCSSDYFLSSSPSVTKTIWHQQALFWCFHWKQQPISPFIYRTRHVLSEVLHFIPLQLHLKSNFLNQERCSGAASIGSQLLGKFPPPYWNFWRNVEMNISCIKKMLGTYFVKRKIQLNYFSHLLTGHNRKWASIFCFVF